MTRDKKDVESSLLKKGFVQNESNHHFFVYISEEGKKSMARTKTSHTPKMKTLSNDLISAMARQCGLTKAQFLNLVDCPLSREDYEEILMANNLL